MASPKTWENIPNYRLGTSKRLATHHEKDNPDNMSEARQRRWLRNSKSWIGLNEKEWRPRRILGSGSNGLVGLWEYTGDNLDMPRQIAVKQVHSDDNGMKWESKFLRDIRTANSDHLVKIYKEVYTEGGTGTHWVRDPLPFKTGKDDYRPEREVSRIYLEYCEDGDLHTHIARLFGREWRGKTKIPEEIIWRYLDCLAKALLVLERGKEDPESEALPGWKPICHFDIKPGNILVGPRDNDHQRTHILKLADFGLALKVREKQDPAWIEHSEWRATEGFMPPEQKFPSHDNRKIGPPTNVWAVGAVMFFFMTNAELDDIARSAFPFKFSNGDELRTMGSALLEAPYSRRLLELVLRCLAWDPDLRISPASILIETASVLAHYDTFPDNSDEPIQEYDPDHPAPTSPLPTTTRDAARQRLFSLSPRSMLLGKDFESPSPVRADAPPLVMGPHEQPAVREPSREQYPFRRGGFLATDLTGKESPDRGHRVVESSTSATGTSSGAAQVPPAGPEAITDRPSLKRKRRGGARMRGGRRRRRTDESRLQDETESSTAVENAPVDVDPPQFEGQAFWGAYNGLPIF